MQNRSNRFGFAVFSWKGRRSQKSEVRSPKSEVRSQKSEVGSRKSEVRNQKSELGSQKSELGSQKSEVASPRPSYSSNCIFHIVLNFKTKPKQARLFEIRMGGPASHIDQGRYLRFPARVLQRPGPI